MTGAVLTLAGSGVAPGSGSVVLSATTWAAIYGTDSASDSPISMLGIGAAVSITATKSSGGTLTYNLNGAPANYTGAFTVHLNDSLSWGITVGHTGQAGTISVTNATTATLLQTFNYSVDSSWTVGGYH